MNPRFTRLKSLSPRWRDALCVIALTALAAATRFHEIGKDSLWLDEAHTYFRSLLPVPELIEDSIKRFHNPSYFLLMHALISKGASEAALRTPSAIASTLTAPLIYAIGRMTSGRAVGVTAGTLYLLSIAQLRYAQEARMYAMLVLCAALAITAATWILVHSTDAARPSLHASVEQRRATLAWVGYGLALVGALYLHNGGAFLCAGVASSFGIALAASPDRRRLLPLWIAANLGALLLWSPWLPQLGSQQERWTTPFTYGLTRLRHLQDVILFGHKQHARGLLVVVLIGVGAYRMRGHRSVVLLLLGVAISGPTILWLVSFHKEVFELRLLLWSGVTVFPLMAAGLQIPARPLWTVPLTLVLVAWCARDLRGYYHSNQRPDWRSAATFLAQHVDKRDVVVVHGTQGRPLEYYWDRVENPPRMLLARGDMNKKTRRNPHVWHAMRSSGKARFDVKIRSKLEAFATVENAYKFDGSVLIRKYKRSVATAP